MPPQLWHFLAWWMLLAAFPLAWALRAHSAMRRDERVYRLTFVVAPILLGVIWLHGLMLDPWFRPHEASFYTERQLQLLAFAAPGVLMAAVLAYRGRRSLEYAWNRRTAAISYALQIGAWLLLHPLAATAIELGESFDWRVIANAFAAQAPRIAVTAVLPLPFMILAMIFARQSVESRRFSRDALAD